MGIWRNDREVNGINRNGHDTQEVWKNVGGVWRMVWTAIRSCFGAGFWRGDRPWIGADAWKG